MLKNERIKLLPPSLERAPEMLEAIRESQQELAVYLPWVPYSLTEEESEKNTQEAMDNFANFENELRFSIYDRASKRFIGAVGLIIRDKAVPYFEIGYWLRSSEVGKGYVTDAVKLVEQYAFNELDANRLEICADVSNDKSRAVAERNGYQQDGIFANHRRACTGELSDTVVYSKTRYDGVKR